jgi:hypothetical protein
MKMAKFFPKKRFFREKVGENSERRAASSER